VRERNAVKNVAKKWLSNKMHENDAKFQNLVENFEKKIKEWVKLEDLYKVVFDDFTKGLRLPEIIRNVVQTKTVYTPYNPYLDVKIIFDYLTKNSIKTDQDFSNFLENEYNKFMTGETPLFASSVNIVTGRKRKREENERLAQQEAGSSAFGIGNPNQRQRR
jgi:hypothetical protein